MSADEIPTPSPEDIAVPELDLSASSYEPGFEELNASSVMESMLPLFLEAGNALLDGKPDAGERSRTLTDSLRRTSSERNEGEDGFWYAAADLAEAVLVKRTKAMDMVHRTEELDQREGFSWKTLCVLSYLGASMDPEIEPRMAARLHMAVSEYVYNHTTHEPVLYEERILPWFVSYWERTFANARFKFYTPKFVALDLGEAAKSPKPVRLQRVLRAVAFGLWEPIPEKARPWFDMAEQ